MFVHSSSLSSGRFWRWAMGALQSTVALFDSHCGAQSNRAYRVLGRHRVLGSDGEVLRQSHGNAVSESFTFTFSFSRLAKHRPTDTCKYPIHPIPSTLSPFPSHSILLFPLFRLLLPLSPTISNILVCRFSLGVEGFPFS